MYRPDDCCWDDPEAWPEDQDFDALPDYERPQHWDAEFMDGAHIEHYNGNSAKINGRVRLAPESTAALKREIARYAATHPEHEVRRPLSASMRTRLDKARRNISAA